MKKSFLRKIFTIISVLSIISQSLTPYAVLLPQTANAQEITEQTTSTNTQTTTVDQSTTQDTVTPTPSQDQTVPTETVTPTPTEDPALVTPTEVNNNSPPSENTNSSETQGIDTLITPTETLVTLTPTQEGLTTNQENTKDEQLNLIVLDNVSAPSIDLEAVESEGSAVLTTDKPDYAPTDTALITGFNLLPNTTYTLRVWSDDAPATSTTVDITSDENGVFAYAYQLDGVYRPNYSAELKDSSGTVVASVTFTDSITYTYTNDSAGANDEPGQKDLTRLGRDLSSNDPLNITWNWDVISMPGSNTADACALFDTNNNGLANYSLCVTWGGSQVQAAGSPSLYSCNDTKTDRCAGAVLVGGSISSSCTVGNNNDDPFPTGDSYQNDTTAICTIPLSDVGGASVASLLDVCSYPSVQPNSDPSDCIIIRSDKGNLTIIKDVNPNDLTTNWNFAVTGATAFNTSISGDGTSGITSVDLGTYSITETAGPNTSLGDYSTTWACTKNGSAYLSGNGVTASNIVIDKVGSVEDSVVCTFTNTRINNGSITIVKDAVPNDAQDFSFTTIGTGLSNFSLDDDADGILSNTRTFSNLASGTYSVSEGSVTGWTSEGGVCNDGSPVSAIALSAGENVTCTFTNTRDTGKIELQKDFVGTPENVTIKIGTSQNGSDIDLDVLSADGTDGEHTVNTGNYFVSETLTTPSNYTSGLVCYNDVNDNDAIDDGDTSHAVNTSTGAVSVGNNDDVICKFTNTRNQGTVIVKKVMVGGTDTFTYTGNPNGSIATNNGTIQATVDTGSYTSTEGTKDGWDLTSVVCSDTNSTGDVTTRTATFSVEANETVTCTFTNTKQATVTVVKNTTGGNDTFGFTSTGANGLPANFNVSTTTGSGSQTYTVTPGVAFSVSETVPSGWDLTSSSCTSGTPASFTPSAGQTITCTFNNTKKGHLIVQKTTVPSADQTVFTINATGSGTITNGGAGTVTDSTDKDYEVTPGNYWVTETVPAGWSKTGDTCQNVDVAAGQTVYCLLTNTKLGSITVVKNTNFGDGTFPFSTTGGLDPVNFNIITSGGTGSRLYSSVLPGSYSVTENTPANWVQGTISCLDGTNPIGTVNGSTASFSLAAGHSIVCTFNNTGQGQLKIVKNTIGGNDTFGFTVSGPTPLTPSILTSGGTGTTGFSTVTAGNYSVSETTIPSNWTLTGTSCTNGQASLDPTGFDINPGDLVTCTFENTRDTGTIELKKHWIGTAGTVTLNIGTTNAGNEVDTELVNGTGGTTGQNSVITGTYFMSESALSDYTTGALSCFNDANNNGRNDNESSITVGSNDSVSVAKNQHVICTYTNTRNQGTIELKKVWSGTAGQTTLNIGTTSNGTDVASVQTGTNGGAPLTTGTKTVDTGTYYVSETGGLTNYSSSLSCTDDGNSVTPGNNNSLTVGKDHTVICIYTNTRDTGTIEIVKNAIGGDNTFEFTVEGDTNLNPSITTTNGTGTTGSLTVDAGTYSVSETTIPNGWSITELICEKNQEQNVSSSEFTVSNGDNIVCTATNKRDTGEIIIRKIIDSDGDINTTNDQTPGEDWEFEVNGTSEDTSNPSISPTDSNGETFSGSINTGEYTVKETIKDGYRILSASCNENEEVTQGTFDNKDSVTNVLVALDATVICEFVNTLTLPSLTITKENDAVGSKSPNDSVGFTITIAAEETGGPADNVKVIDLLPKGFVFNSSSWKVVSSDTSRGVNGDITSSLSTPTYASPGTWNLGHLNSGETLTLTYTATIDGSQQTGTYYDNAWGQGNPVGNTDIIFARAIDPGDLDAADPSEFVGTEVSIVNPNQPGIDYKATSTKEVLGASTYLPATGENTLWVIIATLLLGLGFGTTLVGFKLRRKYE